MLTHAQLHRALEREIRMMTRLINDVCERGAIFRTDGFLPVADSAIVIEQSFAIAAASTRDSGFV